MPCLHGFGADGRFVARVTAEAESTSEANGDLSLGDSNSPIGFVASGDLVVGAIPEQHAVMKRRVRERFRSRTLLFVGAQDQSTLRDRLVMALDVKHAALQSADSRPQFVTGHSNPLEHVFRGHVRRELLE